MNDAEGDHRGGISTFENVTYAHMCVNGNTETVHVDDLTYGSLLFDIINLRVTDLITQMADDLSQ